jgi:branched-chain amino acid transport system permease protein
MTSSTIRLSFTILFMVIIGGLGSLIGSFFGAAFLSALPTALIRPDPALRRADLVGATAEHVTFMLVGA